MGAPAEWSKEEPIFPVGTVVQLLIFSTRTKKMGVATLTVYADGFNDIRGYGGTHQFLPKEWRWMLLPPAPTD